MWIQVLLSVQFFWAAESQQTGPLSFCLTFRLYQDYDTTVTELNEDSVKKISILLLPNDIFYRTFLGHTFCISATPLILWSLLLKFRPAIIETVVGWWEDPIYMTVWSCFYLITFCFFVSIPIPDTTITHMLVTNLYRRTYIYHLLTPTTCT